MTGVEVFMRSSGGGAESFAETLRRPLLGQTVRVDLCQSVSAGVACQFVSIRVASKQFVSIRVN